MRKVLFVLVGFVIGVGFFVDRVEAVNPGQVGGECYSNKNCDKGVICGDKGYCSECKKDDIIDKKYCVDYKKYKIKVDCIAGDDKGYCPEETPKCLVDNNEPKNNICVECLDKEDCSNNNNGNTCDEYTIVVDLIMTVFEFIMLRHVIVFVFEILVVGKIVMMLFVQKIHFSVKVLKNV